MNWKKTLLVALVVLLLLIGLPVLMPGMAAACSHCGPAVVGGPACNLAAVGALFALLVVVVSALLRPSRDRLRDRLHGFLLERPPQFA